MHSSVTEGPGVLVAIIMPMSTDLRLKEAESAGMADENVGMEVGFVGEEVVEKRPKQSSGQTVSR